MPGHASSSAIACVVSDGELDPWKGPSFYRTPSVADLLDYLDNAGFVQISHRHLDDRSGAHLFTGEVPG